MKQRETFPSGKNSVGSVGMIEVNAAKSRVIICFPAMKDKDVIIQKLLRESRSTPQQTTVGLIV